LGNLDGKTFGMNFKISAFTAAIGLARLLEFPKVLEMRKNGRSTLLSYLKEYAFKEIAHIGEPNGYNLVIDMGDNVKAELQMALTNAGIELDTTKYGYKCGYKHQLFLQPNLTCPNAESLIQRLIQLPTDSDCEIIADKFIKAITSTV
jgi:perosamine synthetase